MSSGCDKERRTKEGADLEEENGDGKLAEEEEEGDLESVGVSDNSLNQAKLD